MSLILNGITVNGKNIMTVADATDPYFSSVSLLVNVPGSAGTQNNTFLDGSSNNFTITRQGTATQGTYSPFNGTGGSIYLDGAIDSLLLPNNSLFAFSTSDFTIETFVYPISSKSLNMLYGDCDSSANNGGITIYLDGSNQLIIQSYTSATGVSSISTGRTISNGAWSHMVISRIGTTLYVGINGTVTTHTCISTYRTPTAPTVGAQGAYLSGGREFYGYLSNFRILTGTALYTSNYSVPTAPLTNITNTSVLLNSVNSAIIDSSRKNDIITVNQAQAATAVIKYGNSVYLDGTGDYLTIPDGSQYTFGTSAFTIEAFVYFISLSSTQSIISKYSNATYGWDIAVYTNGSILAGLTGDVYDITSSTGVISSGQWYHVALSGQQGSVKLFVNGTQQGSTYTGSVSMDSTVPLTIGGVYSGGLLNPLTGYLNQIRITKGVARYTSNFTPPSQAFPTN